MPKPSKSSASKATRQKHAKKSTTPDGDDPETAQHQPKGKKLSKAQRKALPKIKQYIPPPKPPAPPIPDPLDGQGLARTLPPELVVVLRRLGKKDDVTRRKGLEDLKEGWVSVILAKTGDEIELDVKESALLSAVPVWMHNLASLLQSPFHRSAALQLHADLLCIPSIRAAIIDTLALGLLPGTQNRDVIGSWLQVALEEGKRAGGAGLRSWAESTSWTPAGGKIDLTSQLSTLVGFLSLSILDPVSLHDEIYPAPVASTPQAPSKAAKGKARVEPVAPSTPSAEDEERAEERWARYRVSGLVGLSWLEQQLDANGTHWTDELRALLENPLLWSALSSDPGGSNLGAGQPPVRRAAYSLLSVIVDHRPHEVEKPALLRTLSSAVLGACWAEQEPAVWETAGSAVVKFLSKNREAWTIAALEEEVLIEEAEDEGDDNGQEDDTDAEEADEEDGPEADDSHRQPAVTLTSSPYFEALLDFISTTCPAVPHLTYPLLVVIISTLPDTLLPLDSAPSLALQNLFSHLWAPVDARLLSTHSLPGVFSAFQAFFRDAVDCIVYLVGKSWRRNGHDTARWLVNDQLGERAWKEGVLQWGGKAGRRRGVSGSETEAGIFGEALARITAIDSSLAEGLLSIVGEVLLKECFPPEGPSVEQILPRALPILETVKASNAIDSIGRGVDEVISDLAKSCATHLSCSTQAIHVEVLTRILSSHASLVKEETHSEIASYLQSQANSLLSLPAELAVSFCHAVATSASSPQASNTIWALIDSPSVLRQTRFDLATSVMNLESSPLLTEGSLDAVAEEAVQAALAGDTAAISVASACMGKKTYLSTDALHTVLALAATSLHDSVVDLLTIGGGEIPDASLQVFAVYAKEALHDIITSDVYIQALVAVHHLVVVLPRSSGIHPPLAATDIWMSTRTLSPPDQAILSSRVFEDLASLLGQLSCRVSPGVLVDVALVTTVGDETRLTAKEAAHRLLPSVETISENIFSIAQRQPHVSLPIVDPLIPFNEHPEEAISRSSNFDSAGRSIAARYVEAILALFQADRRLAQDAELLRTALIARALALDAQAVPGASRGLYSAEVSLSHLADLVREVEGSLSFALSPLDEVPTAWHTATIQHLRGPPANDADFLQSLLATLQRDIEHDVAARTFRDVLSRHLRQSGASETEAEVWLNYAMRQSDKLPALAQAIFLAIKSLLLDTKPFETAQNRLANSLTGIPAAQANTKGIPALRLLVASSPPADAASVFLPQQRAVFVLRHVSGWLTSDDADDLAEEIEYRIAEIYTALAPIVQDLSGAHWDSIFDLVESGLEGSSLDEPETYCLLYQSLLLLQQIRDLCVTNKSLRALWTGKQTHLSLVLKLFLQCRDAHSVPLQLIQALILDLINDITEDAIGDIGMSELCDLLRLSSSTAVQCTAYRILNQVVRRRTLALVLEVETAIVDDEGKHEKAITLPEQLVGIVEKGAAVDWYEAKIETILGQLLAWMAILDHFEDASRTLRWAYLDQLNSSKLITDCLLPMLFAMLGVSEVGAWNFPASSYAVEEFYPDLLQLDEHADLVPLASHVFYRALVTIPSAMRTYYESLKDRQLSMSLLAFTARHYSPTIIALEFSALREPRAMAQLTEEGLNVRIAQGGGATVAAGTSGGSEAIASYVVDEQPMEIGIRLPAEFPLRGVEVRDLRRVGVPENKWRGWLMSVQQTITSRNGLILEALTVFKKNVALHFEGVVECAICYSIISLTDRTLPTKPCRTCKNRFHASCLFKWFNSSHSSSCPLCRALF